MLTTTLVKLTALVLTAAAGSSAAESLVPGSAPAARMACYDETPALHCYNGEFDVRRPAAIRPPVVYHDATC
jgi:hypothetical protein